MNAIHTFPTTESIDNTRAISDMFSYHVKFRRLSGPAYLDLFSVMREQNPVLTLGQFTHECGVPARIIDWIESKLETVQ